MSSFVEITDLVKSFKGRGFGKAGAKTFTAVDRINLNIEKNTVFGLVGESGCGKTTLSRALLFLDPPTSGDVKIGGIDLEELSRRKLQTFRRKVQIVFQDPNSALNPKMTIENSIKEGLANIGYDKKCVDSRVDELLELVGITTSHKKRHPHEFSGGQKQRIVIARALSVEPEFLILDEPVSNLDVSIQAQIINLLLDLKEKLSLTYLFISHDLNIVSYLSDRIAVMYKGQIVETAPAEVIMTRPVHPYTLKLFSSMPGITPINDEIEDPVFHVDDEDYTEGLPEGRVYHLPDSGGAAPEMLEISDGHFVACYNKQ
jgi:ABC-type oligopeptide transport system ATPase subunit